MRQSLLFPLAFWLLLLALAPETARAQSELQVFTSRTTNWVQHQNNQNALYLHFLERALPLLESRQKEVGEIKDLAGWKSRQQQVQEKLREALGPFPARSPLHARVTKTIQKDGFRVEQVVFASQPGFFVTGSLYIPASPAASAKRPTILFCSGHAQPGYRTQGYQREILNYVRKGFVVFAFDPVGQGERKLYSLPDRQVLNILSPTHEHSYPGAQAFLTGSSLAKYMIWDGIRAVDYLLTRPEVDPQRIGITGRSGGGTQTAYIAALDERIHAAAPEAFITSFARLLQTNGPQDAEQNLHQALARGLDHADFLVARAPKPTLVVATTNDIFSVQGARETVREAERAFQALGQPTHLKLVEDLGEHQSTKLNREQKYAFFQHHLRNPGNSLDEEVVFLTPEELTVTPTGQVVTALGSETVFSLNRKEAGGLSQKLERERKNLARHLPQAVVGARQLAGYEEPREGQEPVFTGRVVRRGYTIEKYFLAGEGNYAIPFLLFVPDTPTARSLLYLHPAGKQAEADSVGEIARYVQQGYTVLAPDLVGTGETGPGPMRGDSHIQNNSYNLWYFGVLTGRSIVGIRAGDIVRLTKYLQQARPQDELTAFAKGAMGAALLHAAAFYPHFQQVVLVEPLSSYQSLVETLTYNPDYIPHAVAGGLRAYDLPDLAASLAPTRLLLLNPLDGQGHPLDQKSLDRYLQVVRQGYALKGAKNNLQTERSAGKEGQVEKLLGWLAR